MNFKPADFLISVFEFFSVLLPGVMVCFFINIQYSKFIFGTVKYLGTMDSKGVERWIIFLFASFLIGHLLYALGSKLDSFYDKNFQSSKAARNFHLTFLAADYLKTTKEDNIKKNTFENTYSTAKFETRKYRHKQQNNGNDLSAFNCVANLQETQDR